VAVLAHNVLALLQRCVEQVHQEQKPPPEVSSYHLALHIRSGYEGMLIALPPERWRSYEGDPSALADRLLRLVRNIDRHQQARTRGHQTERIRRRRCSTRPRFYRMRARQRTGGNTLKGVALNAGWFSAPR